jgi:hypothetical protein
MTPRAIDVRVQCLDEAAVSLIIFRRNRPRMCALQARRRYLRRCPASARRDLGHVVLKNQHWRLARQARDTTINGLARDEVTHQQDPKA